MEIATIITPHSTSLSGILLPSEPNIHEGPEYEKSNKISRHVLLSNTSERKLISHTSMFMAS